MGLLALLRGLPALLAAASLAVGVPGHPKDQDLSELFKTYESTPAKPPKPKVEKGRAYVAMVHLEAEIDEEVAGQVVREIGWANEDGASAVVLEINTPGGIVPNGFQIIRAIERSKAPVWCVVDGAAFSMGFAVLQSCHRRQMTKRSVLMAHEPWLWGAPPTDDPVQNENRKNMMAATARALAEQMCSRMALPFQDCRHRFSDGKEWWFDWEEADRWGAVDEIVDRADVTAIQLGESYKKPK